ncbi:MAG: hypothetical protein CMM26_02930 [Rhodospirillaceae bacterium]|nr:hypothetical protein [Rhodospirillaceae bacterium]|tara:strand:- start:1974 stop:2387 length:414 start_codon:yes stop_codon:yes gene_type:complete
MLRRLFEGLVMLIVVWAALNQIEAGLVAVVIIVSAVFAFTAWRIRRVWQRYRMRIMIKSRLRNAPEAANAAVENEMLSLRGKQYGRGAELNFWTGFVLGGAITMDTPNPVHAGDMYELESIGGSFGGDMGGSLGGDM